MFLLVKHLKGLLVWLSLSRDGPNFSIAMQECFLIHKPINVVSSRVDSAQDDPRCKREEIQSRITIYELVRNAGFPDNFGLVGRLDSETSGVMLMTSNNVLASAIRDPINCEYDENGCEHLTCSRLWSPPPDFDLSCKEKTYLVTLMSPRVFLEGETTLLQEMRQPLHFSRFTKKHETKEASITHIRTYRDPDYSFKEAREHLGWCMEVEITLVEGKHRQIRRLANRSRLTVTSLIRTRMANILSIDSVPNPGDCRWLTKEEMQWLYKTYGLLEVPG